MKKSSRPCTPQANIDERAALRNGQPMGGASLNREALEFRMGTSARRPPQPIAAFKCGTSAASGGGPWSWRGDGRGWPF